jgi:hypothetical protein
MIPPYEAPSKFAHGVCERVRRGFYIFHTRTRPKTCAECPLLNRRLPIALGCGVLALNLYRPLHY